MAAGLNDKMKNVKVCTVDKKAIREIRMAL